MDLGATEFDIQVHAEKGAWCQLLHPVTGVELGVEGGRPCRIRVKGADSLAYEEAVARTVSLRSKDALPKKGRVSERQLLEAAEKNSQNQARELAEITLGWEGLEWDGESFEFSSENAIKLYGEHRWIREQVIEFFGDRANFTGSG